MWVSASGVELEPVYHSHHVADGQRLAAGSLPGAAPFLRGAYPEMYRAKDWRIFQLSGFGNPSDMNERIRFLLDAGETGVIVKHDRMTDDHLYDVDHPDIVERREDVGLTGTVTVGLRDYETIMDGIPLESIYVKPGGGVPQSAPYTLACYWSTASRRGIPLEKLRGTGQSDFFLTYIGCPPKEQIPPGAAMRLNLDIIDWCMERMPHWVPVSIAGYNGADSGLNAWQELGAVFANAIEYLEAVADRVDSNYDNFARMIGGVNFRTSMDLFEDAAKLRTARKMWHDLLTNRYGVTDERSLRLRIHVVTAGSNMAYQEPLNNIVRGTVMALGAALGGTQSLGVSGYDEAMSIPSDHAHLMSIRIQQILQEETNITAVADPLGGSYYIEHLGQELERKALAFMSEIEKEGGFLSAIDSGWLLDQAARGQMEEVAAIENGDKRIVGTNVHHSPEELMPIQGFEGRSGEETWERAMRRLTSLRRERHGREATRRLRDLEAACRTTENVIPRVMEAVQADATIGEIGDVFRSAFGVWEVPMRF
ncbi:MAG: methylmalonyl-CoA mutase [Acidimicrobiia bacterium]|nr:methylmalonyl-CoA mutase [Acidimicrobiia bacterium]